MACRRHFAGEQHLAVVARHVDVDAGAQQPSDRRRPSPTFCSIAWSLWTTLADRRSIATSVPAPTVAPTTTTAHPRSAQQRGEREPARLRSATPADATSASAPHPRLRAACCRWRRTGNESSAGGTSWMRAVRSCGTHRCTSPAASIAPIWPPPLPVSATTRISRSCAATIAATTLAEFPDVDNASSASPLAPSARTCFAKTCSNE